MLSAIAAYLQKLGKTPCLKMRAFDQNGYLLLLETELFGCESVRPSSLGIP